MENIDKYIKLLCDKCLNFNKSNSLFICYEKALNQDFVDKIVEYVKKRGINDIYLNDSASFVKHDILKNIKLEDIEKEKIFDNSIWDEYAKKDSAFLIIESEIPGLMEDIDADKIAMVRKIARETKPIYRKKQNVDDISWCICAYPNEYWAKDIFKDQNNAYDLLLNNILNMCMCDKEDPIKAWEEFLKTSKKRAKKLDDLHIKCLHYTNSLGTDLKVYLSDEACFSSAYSEKNMIVNMPSYEVFTTPNTIKTEGIVYSSKPLIYNGVVIDKFYLEFKNGKVVNYDALIGKDILKGIINSDEYSNMLGECALVNYDSPISNTGLVFKTTLFDENASCHLALGAGFSECIKNSCNKTLEELFDMGVNKSTNHVDFMIGTKDLKIDATTDNGIITIFEEGNFII